MRATQIRRCRHGIDGDTCPSCAEEDYVEAVAIRLAARDHVTVDRWRAEFDARLTAGCFEREAVEL